MFQLGSILPFVKYVFVIAIFIILLGAPAWLARQNKKDKDQMGLIRISSWLLGWTGIGYFVAIWLAVRK